MENLRELGIRVVRKVYLVTYSQADENICNTRDAFSNLVIAAFSFNTGPVRLLHWAVCKEPHDAGGFHFHMCMSLSNNKRWGPAKRALAAQGVVVHFQERYDVCHYVGVYIYVCKSDRNVLHSNPHLDLSNVARYRTAAASAAN